MKYNAFLRGEARTKSTETELGKVSKCQERRRRNETLYSKGTDKKNSGVLFQGLMIHIKHIA